MTKFEWLAKIFARENSLTIDLNLMWNQLTCLNASKTQSKLPIMMQTQIWATNMRWEGTTLKSLQPRLVSMPNTTICHSWLSHYYDDQIWMTGREIFARDDHPTIDLNLMSNQSTCLNASITLSKLQLWCKHKSEQPIPATATSSLRAPSELPESVQKASSSWANYSSLELPVKLTVSGIKYTNIVII